MSTTAPNFQVCIDCADPHSLARFYSEAFGYELEQNHDQIIGLLEQGHVTREDAIEIDGRLFWAKAAALNDPEGGRPRLLLQVVPEPKTIKNRVHLDWRFGVDAHEEVVARLTSLGATTLWEGSEGPFTWITMADPEGNEFCVS